MNYVLLLILLLFHSIDIYPMEPSEAEIPNEYMTQLMWAVEVGELKIAESHIKNKADVNASNVPIDPEGKSIFVDGKTPLTLAIASHSAPMVELLLKKKANPNQPNKIGWTPLHVAYYFNNPEIINLLEKHKADKKQPIKIGWQTPLEWSYNIFNEQEPDRNLSSFSFDFAMMAKKHGYKPNQLISRADIIKIYQLEQLEEKYQGIQKLTGPDQYIEREFECKKQTILDEYTKSQTIEEFSPETLKDILDVIREREAKTTKDSEKLLRKPALSKSDDDDDESSESKSSKFKKIRRALSSSELDIPKQHHHSPPLLRRGISFWERPHTSKIKKLAAFIKK